MKKHFINKDNKFYFVISIILAALYIAEAACNFYIKNPSKGAICILWFFTMSGTAIYVWKLDNNNEEDK